MTHIYTEFQVVSQFTVVLIKCGTVRVFVSTKQKRLKYIILVLSLYNNQVFYIAGIHAVEK